MCTVYVGGLCVCVADATIVVIVSLCVWLMQPLLLCGAGGPRDDASPTAPAGRCRGLAAAPGPLRSTLGTPRG